MIAGLIVMTVPAADAAPVCILRWRLKSHKAQYGTPTALRSAGVCSGIMSPGSSRSLNLRSRTIARARKQVPKPLAQNIFFCTLPFALRGSSATKIARFGNLNLASLFCERLLAPVARQERRPGRHHRSRSKDNSLSGLSAAPAGRPEGALHAPHLRRPAQG